MKDPAQVTKDIAPLGPTVDLRKATLSQSGDKVDLHVYMILRNKYGKLTIIRRQRNKSKMKEDD